MIKKVYLTIILIIISIGCSIPGMSTASATKVPAVDPAAPPQPTQTMPVEPEATVVVAAETQVLEPTKAPDVKVEDREIDEESDTPPYTIKIHYPFVTGSTIFNDLVDQTIQDPVKLFKKDVVEIEPARVQNNLEFSSSLEINYSLLQASPGVVSVMFTVFNYIAGAAHPLTLPLTLTYDFTQQRELKLADLFKPGSNYLELIAEFCKTYLTKNGMADFIEGADPKEENYTKWTIEKDGLMIHFDPYQVAPYAGGLPTVLVPYSELDTVILTEGPLAPLVQNP